MSQQQIDVLETKVALALARTSAIIISGSAVTVERVAGAPITPGVVVQTNGATQELIPVSEDPRNTPFAALSIAASSPGQSATFIAAGPVPTTVLQLGPGYACAVGIDASGNPVRATDPTCVSAPNWLGDVDAFGNVTMNPRRAPVFYVKDFGLVPDDFTPNDMQINILRVALNNSPHNVIEFDFGVYRFNGTVGGLGLAAFPFGTIFRGQGISDRFRPDPGPGPLGNKTGSVLAFYGPGAGLHIGYDAGANYGNGGAVRDLEFRGCLTTGAVDYPNINEIGLEIVTDTSISVERCRFNGFKYGLSLDGAETIWVRDISFDGGTTSGYQDMTTDLGDNSACGIRIGSWVAAVTGAANGIYIQNCQFNNSFYGTWHKDGVGCEVRNCNYELPGGWALLHGAQQIHYGNCLGEGQLVSSFHGRNEGAPSACFGLIIENCFFDGSCPTLKLVNVTIGQLVFIGNECSNTVAFQIIEGGSLVTGPVLAEANHLPAVGPSAFQLSADSYANTVGGTAVNHFTRADAALDVQLIDYTIPLLRLKASQYIFSDEGHTEPVGGRHYEFDQVYNADTGIIGTSRGLTIEWIDFLAGAATADIGQTPSPGKGAGQVWLTVQACREVDQTKMGSWRIRQQYADDGTGPVLLGTPVIEYAEDLDGAYVAPTLVIVAGEFAAHVQAHPTAESEWGAKIDFHHAGG